MKKIERILIANNGLSALKCILSLREWILTENQDSKSISLIVLATQDDLNASAEFIKLSDHYILVPSGPSSENYGHVQLIVDNAVNYHVDAVWSGWGHASENPELPKALAKKNIIHLGPSYQSMSLLGDKINATIVAQTLGIPTIPWSGKDIKLDLNKTYMEISKDLIRQGMVTTEEEASAASGSINFPQLLKATNAGGGKGIRKVYTNDDIVTAFKQICLEVPNSPIMIMEMLTNVKHIEVQILGDNYGNVISLYHRDCSIQRRHQKLIEEGPAIAPPTHILKQMENAAVEIGTFARYSSVGTVEFLYHIESQKFYFLEFNPRLQVEHPCTELISKINLLGCQYMIGCGYKLEDIPPIKRLYGVTNNDPIDFNKEKKPPKGHVVSARIVSENPDENFKPTIGCIKELIFRGSWNVWAYFSIYSEGRLHEYSDSQFGHIFAWGKTRPKAIQNLLFALKCLTINGDISTNVEFITNLLQTEQFNNNLCDTGTIDSLIQNNYKESYKKNNLIGVVFGALFIARQNFNQNRKDFETSLLKGHIIRADIFFEPYECELICEGYKYNIKVCEYSSECYFLTMNNTYITIKVNSITHTGMLFSIGENNYTGSLKEIGEKYYVQVDAVNYVLSENCDPSLLRTPSAGKIVSFLVNEGDYINPGTDYAEIEVMKMLVTLQSTVAGKIHFLKPLGTIVGNETIIAKVDFSENSDSHSLNLKISNDDLNCLLSNQESNRFFIKEDSNESIDSSSSFKESSIAKYVIQRIENAKNFFHNIFMGYVIIEPYFSTLLHDTFETFLNDLNKSQMISHEMVKLFFIIAPHLDYFFQLQLKKILVKYKNNLSSVLSEFPQDEFEKWRDSYASKLNQDELEKFTKNIEPLSNFIQELSVGLENYKLKIKLNVLEEYLTVENYFSENNYEKSIQSFMNDISNEPQKIPSLIEIIRSHCAVSQKNELVLLFINDIWKSSSNPLLLNERFNTFLVRVSKMNRPPHANVSLRCSQLLLASKFGSFEHRYNEMEAILLDNSKKTLSKNESINDPENIPNLTELIRSETSIFDILPCFYFHKKEYIRKVALETYIRRAYHSYEVIYIKHGVIINKNYIYFKYRLPEIVESDESETKDKSLKIKKVISFCDDIYDFQKESTEHTNSGSDRSAFMICFNSMDDVTNNFDQFINSLNLFELNSESFNSFITEAVDYKIDHSEVMNSFDTDDDTDSSIKTFYVVIRLAKSKVAFYPEKALSKFSSNILRKNQDKLTEHNVARFTFIFTSCSGDMPFYFSFYRRNSYIENKLYRNVDPSQSSLLELHRMKHFNIKLIPTENKSINFYFGEAKDKKVYDKRFFIRTVLRNEDLKTAESSYNYLLNMGEVRLLEVLEQLEYLLKNNKTKMDSHHLFFNILPVVALDEKLMISGIFELIVRHGMRIINNRITEAEIRGRINIGSSKKCQKLRMIIKNQSVLSLNIDCYIETYDPKSNNIILKHVLSKPFSPNSLADIALEPYPIKNLEEEKRFASHLYETQYVYDIPDIFKKAVLEQFKMASLLKGSEVNEMNLKENLSLIRFEELIWNNQDNNFRKVQSKPGSNTIGIISWHVFFNTAEFPQGREIILIANDITFMFGSFGLPEIEMFQRTAKYARKKGLPLIFISVNSGARIGLCDELKHLFYFKWKDEQCLEKGIEYLYLKESDYNNLKDKKIANFKKVTCLTTKETHFVITDIFGDENRTFGVENLKGSAIIANEMALCYEEIFTLSMVSKHSVGIGSYLVRLGRRVIQVENSHIILTGFNAINRVLGKKIYNSNNQLGGTQLMLSNGVSQIFAKDFYSGISNILKWLSFVPRTNKEKIFNNDFLMSSHCYDPIDRDITVEISLTPNKIDPRAILSGFYSYIENKWFKGFFDHNSFIEHSASWANTIVCGRARLGNIPVGVIITETNPKQLIIPADAADQNDHVRTEVKSAQVLYPSSAFKFSQTIDDFKNENLPVFIFPNWRGFSGGMKDMYNEMLKYGAMMVNSLRHYTSNIFIYLLPTCELRGGAWAVLDPALNKFHIEMFASENCSANVLEPDGLSEIKFKEAELKSLFERMNSSEIEKNEFEHKFNNEKHFFVTAATKFAELHDTPTCLNHRKVVSGIIEWKKSRKFFYYRLMRKLLVKNMCPSSNKEDYVNLENFLYKTFISFVNEEKNDKINMDTLDTINLEELFVKWLQEKKHILIDEISKLFTR